MATKMPTLTEMLKAGVHFGHQKSRWHPKMAPYLFGVRSGVHVIDLDKTVEELDKALDYVRSLAAKGKVILFVGTKRQARPLIKAAAEACGMPFLTERWIGGLITNFEECKRRLKKYKSLKDMVETGEIEKYTKHEQSAIKKQIIKMDKYLSGLTSLEKIPDALYLADLRVEKTAAAEAKRMRVPMVAVCDSNVDPTKVEFPIPANDDAVNAIKMVGNLIAEAVNEGKKDFEKNAATMKAAAEKQAAEAKASPVAKALDTTMAQEKITTKAAPKSGTKERRALKKEESV